MNPRLGMEDDTMRCRCWTAQSERVPIGAREDSVLSPRTAGAPSRLVRDAAWVHLCRSSTAHTSLERTTRRPDDYDASKELASALESPNRPISPDVAWNRRAEHARNSPLIGQSRPMLRGIDVPQSGQMP